LEHEQDAAPRFGPQPVVEVVEAMEQRLDVLVAVVLRREPEAISRVALREVRAVTGRDDEVPDDAPLSRQRRLPRRRAW
jgi:hypothetical protein